MVHESSSINIQELIEDQGKTRKDLGQMAVGREGAGGAKGNSSLSHVVIRMFVVPPVEIR